MTLASWQSRLGAHFRQLRQKRTALAGARPLFGLEHGLSELELDQLQEDIRTHIAASHPSRQHSLPWMIYSCEIGYGYAGDEYWQTFEERTPGWARYGDRHWIRRCFRLFHEEYGGARPIGAWAEHFSIICWPITHAILPKDLQRQLAHILYDVRHALTAEHFDSPETLGNLIAVRGWNRTSRFQQLAQEPEIIGQIAAALLLGEERETDGLILDATLRRISADLEGERRTRDWLRAARRSAQQGPQLRGLSKAQTSRVTAQHAQETDLSEQVRRLGIEPRIILRPSQRASWAVYLEIPDLTHLMSRQTLASAIVKNNRETLIQWIDDPDHYKPGVLMPRMQLHAHETEELVDYLLTLR